ncbi:MAG: hypothetical protein WAN79_07660 [Opitutaceae bacterium]
MSGSATHAAVEAVARDSFGRLVAYLAVRSTGPAGMPAKSRTVEHVTG